jgi:translation elongation factor P/translation initiation factor 5A
MLSNAVDIRKGYLVLHQGRMCTVSDWSIMRNDRRQYVFVTLKDLETGRISELKENGDTKFEVLEKENVDLSHSYSDGNEEVFYDENGTEYRCPREAAADALLWPAETYLGFVVNERLVSVTPPSSVILRVTDTAPPIKTGSNSFKDAILENGVKVRVSQLVASGERVRVDPATLEFRERIGP